MGLAGRKQKQRIPADPRNLSWADDASRFGLSYLSKFGWDASKGLGSSGDGIKTHLKVQQKLDVMGIGAQHQRDPNGIAWKQNKDFEALLKRLNESAEQGRGTHSEDTEEEGMKVHETAIGKAFVRAQEEKAGRELENESSATTKKRKREDADNPNASENTKKKREKGKEKREKSSPGDSDSVAPAIDTTSESSSKLHSEPIPKSRPMAHRARIRAAKRIAGKSASAISEILGIAPSSSISTSASTTAPTPPCLLSSTPQSSLSLDNLTTSTKSVADYFKEKLLARSFSSSSPASSSAPSGSATPGLGATCPEPVLSPPGDEVQLQRRDIDTQAPPVSPPLQIPEAGSPSAGGDSNADTLTEKQRRKVERKAEKRKRREAKASQARPESVSSVAKEQVEEERAQKTSKKRRKTP
ncbi:hypothetical protein L210DRAFT_3500379 [Boletus edulis BED1]|uniref:PinX1-related protein 1 n=1 Tax=Boletus edulis BED1 TaxID=1328754 RepID=A0AAD4C5M2_BOLED|nr:hypothetical protein L210DRAFT_3500379 [Boletus edulis BED1]